MVAALKLENLRASGETSRQPDTGHRGLGAAVHHAHFFDRGNESADGLCHFDLERIRRSEAEPAQGGFPHGLDHRRSGVTQNRWPPCAHIINQLLVIDRRETRSGGRFYKKRLAAHTSERPHGGIHPAWDSFFGRLEKQLGLIHKKRISAIGRERF